jgi:hypothetical protein
MAENEGGATLVALAGPTARVGARYHAFVTATQRRDIVSQCCTDPASRKSALVQAFSRRNDDVVSRLRPMWGIGSPGDDRF